MTLESVSGRSGISISMLVSLEQGEFGSFDASLLARNIIRAYCRAIEIDPEPLIDNYASEIAKCNIQDIGIKQYGEKMKILHRRRRMLSFPLLLLLLSSGAVFYGGMWVSEKRARMYAPPSVEQILSQEDLPAELRQKLGPAVNAIPPGSAARGMHVANSGPGPRDADNALNQAENHLKEAELARLAGKPAGEPKVAEQPPAESREPDSQQDIETPAKLALSNSTEAVADDGAAAAPGAPQKFRFAVEADDKVWIQVKIDNKLTRSAMLHHGEKREWNANDNMQVVVGNAGGIRMKWNEQAIKAPREQGRVLRFRLPDYVRE